MYSKPFPCGDVISNRFRLALYTIVFLLWKIICMCVNSGGIRLAGNGSVRSSRDESASLSSSSHKGGLTEFIICDCLRVIETGLGNVGTGNVWFGGDEVAAERFM